MFYYFRERKCLKKTNKQAETNSSERSYSVNFACSHCNKRFVNKRAMVDHERIHNEEKKFTCSYCGRKFRLRQHLFSHELFHTGEKPYGCPHCDYRCRQKHHLKVHKCNQSHASKNHNSANHDTDKQKFARLDRMNQSLFEASMAEFASHTSDTPNPPLDTKVPSNSSSFSNYSLITNAPDRFNWSPGPKP